MALRDFSQCEPREGLESLCALCARTLLLRNTAAITELCRLLGAVNAGDPPQACRCYHDLTAALLSSGARRVSGDLWRDFLLYTLLETPHAFARLCAAGGRDEAVELAMEEELAILGPLSRLRGADLVRMMEARRQELKLRSGRAKDDIEMFSTAVWSGGTPRSLPTPEEQKAPVAVFGGELKCAAWSYGEASLRESYVADEAMEEIYARLLNSRDWTAQLEDLRCFFSSYGCGGFLKDRAFLWKDGAFAPLPARLVSQLPEPVFFPEQHERLLNCAIRFMQGGAPEHALLTGGPGMGKTAQVFSLAEELPEARLIMADGQDLPGLCAEMAAQPLRFLLLFDGVEPAALPPSLPLLLPPNAMACVTARSGNLEWACRIFFPSISPAAFPELVRRTLEASGGAAEQSRIHNACIDHQVDARDHLSVSAALRIARQLSAD